MMPEDRQVLRCDCCGTEGLSYLERDPLTRGWRIVIVAKRHGIRHTLTLPLDKLINLRVESKVGLSYCPGDDMVTENTEAATTAETPADPPGSYFDNDAGKEEEAALAEGAGEKGTQAGTQDTDASDSVAAGAPAGVAEAPAVEPGQATEAAPQVTTPPVATGPSESDTLRQQLAQQALQIQEHEAQQRQAAVEAKAVAYQQELVIQHGFTPEQAQHVATQSRDAWNRENQVQAEYDAYRINESGKMQAAMLFGKQYNTDPGDLLQYDTPQAMEAAAKQSSEIASLKAQVAKLTQAQVPPSTYATGESHPAAASGEAKLLRRYSDGENLTDAELVQIFPEHNPA